MGGITPICQTQKQASEAWSIWTALWPFEGTHWKQNHGVCSVASLSVFRQLPSPGETKNKDSRGPDWSFTCITNYLGWENMYPVPRHVQVRVLHCGNPHCLTLLNNEWMGIMKLNLSGEICTATDLQRMPDL